MACSTISQWKLFLLFLLFGTLLITIIIMRQRGDADEMRNKLKHDIHYKTYINGLHGGQNATKQSAKHISSAKVISNCDKECMRFKKRITHMKPGQMRAAIYYLVQPKRIESLLQSLQNIDKYFNDKFHYPVIIFHEGNFTAEHRQRVENATKSDVYFQILTFVLPDFITRPVATKQCGKDIGYRHMCRFHSKLIYKLDIVHNLDYIWRLDDDSFIMSDVIFDVFRYMSEHDIIYGYRGISNDIARCVVGLWNNATRYIEQHNITTQFFKAWRENQIYYNNFEISSMKLWLSQNYKDYIDMIDQAGGIYYHRWGDAPIKSIAVTMFVPQNKTHMFRDVSYKHKCKECLTAVNSGDSK